MLGPPANRLSACYWQPDEGCWVEHPTYWTVGSDGRVYAWRGEQLLGNAGHIRIPKGGRIIRIFGDRKGVEIRILHRDRDGVEIVYFPMRAARRGPAYYDGGKRGKIVLCQRLRDQPGT